MCCCTKRRFEIVFVVLIVRRGQTKEKLRPHCQKLRSRDDQRGGLFCGNLDTELMFA